MPQYYSEQVLSESLMKLGPLAVRLNEVLRFSDYLDLLKNKPKLLKSLRQDFIELLQETYVYAQNVD